MQSSQRCESNNFKSHTSNLEVAPDMSKTVNFPPPVQTEPTVRGKQTGKSKVSKNTKSGIHRPGAGNTLLDYDSVKLFINLHISISPLVFIITVILLEFMLGVFSLSDFPNSTGINNCRYDSSLGMSILKYSSLHDAFLTQFS